MTRLYQNCRGVIFFFQAEDGIRDLTVTGVQTCALPILARDLGMSQPQASKHLRVLREVGLVRVRGAGKKRLYGLDARGLRPVHEWVGGFRSEERRVGKECRSRWSPYH